MAYRSLLQSLNCLLSNHYQLWAHNIQLQDSHSEIKLNRKDVVIRNIQGRSKTLSAFWIHVLSLMGHHTLTCGYVSSTDIFIANFHAVKIYVLKQLGTLVLDGNFLLVDLCLRNIIDKACSVLDVQRKTDQVPEMLLPSSNSRNADSMDEDFDQVDGDSSFSKDSSDSPDNQISSGNSCSETASDDLTDKLMSLRNACVKDGGTFIYSLWRNLLHQWLADSRNKVYIVTPFLDTGKLQDICNIVVQNQSSANIDSFYVRKKCDDPLCIMDIVRRSTSRFSLQQKLIIKEKVISKMVCDFTSRFHCKFITCVRDDKEAQVLVTSANFTRQHFNCSNAETVFYQDMSADDFKCRFLHPLQAVTQVPKSSKK